MSNQPDFETALKKLEKIVHTLEEGNISLQEALQSFEEGIKLINLCEEKLEATEKKIEILLKGNKDKKKGIKFDPQDKQQNI